MSEEDQKLHELTVDALVARLKTTGTYDSIDKHFEYRKGGQLGEADVVATRGNAVHYYEVKCRANTTSYGHALEQFDKFRRLCNVLDAKFIYVTPTTVKRVYLK